MQRRWIAMLVILGLFVLSCVPAGAAGSPIQVEEAAVTSTETTGVFQTPDGQVINTTVQVQVATGERASNPVRFFAAEAVLGSNETETTALLAAGGTGTETVSYLSVFEVEFVYRNSGRNTLVQPNNNAPVTLTFQTTAGLQNVIVLVYNAARGLWEASPKQSYNSQTGEVLATVNQGCVVALAQVTSR